MHINIKEGSNERVQEQKPHKTYSKMADINLTFSVITLNKNELNTLRTKGRV